MTRFRLLLAALIFSATAPAQAYWEYGHESVARIAEANMSAKARANMQRLLRAAPMLGTPKCAMRNIADVSVWADCIKGDRVRWGYTNSWHYQNVDICKPFDLKSACADGNCVSAQIDRNIALLSNQALPAHVRLEALAFLVHFVGDIHQPLHAGDRADRGGNDLKTTYGVMPGYNLHSVWDGLLADRALSAAPSIVRPFTAAEKAAVAQGNVRQWSEENWAISKEIAYPRAVDGDPCGAKPTAPVVIDEADVAASRAALRQQVERGGIRLARLLDEALR
nr:S1/P1 nuclease [uncultured Sphingorhabdus sp.]